MNQALYRRYRPEMFSEVIGQEHVTEPLSQALRSGRISHAYLFSGPRGCGKTTSARILARCLNCATGPTPDPCGTCDSCRELGRGGSGSLDVVEIDAASHGGVDDTRELRERAVFAPARDRYKVFILDEAHMVTPQGFNALLKIVEEPPSHVKFVFATTEPEKVLPTIRSRSHHYPFRLVPPGIMTDYMAQISQAESVTVEKGVLDLVVKAGGGSVRDTESVLDQLMAGSVDGQVTYKGATALLGYTPASLLEQMVSALGKGDGAAMFAVVEQVVESGHEPRRFAEDLLERLRDLLVMAASGDQAQAALRSLPADQLEVLQHQAKTIGLHHLSTAADAINTGLSEMVGATSPRLKLELMTARALVSMDKPLAPPRPIGEAIQAQPVAAQQFHPGPGQSTSSPRPMAASASAAPHQSARATADKAAGDAVPSQPVQVAKTGVAPGVTRRAFVDWEEVDEPPTPLQTSPSTGPRPDGPPKAPAITQPARPEPRATGTTESGPPSSPTVSRLTSLDKTTVVGQWESVMTALRTLNKVAGSMAAQDSYVLAAQGNQVTIAFNNPTLGRRFAERFTSALNQALSQVFGQPVTSLVASEPVAATASVPANSPDQPTSTEADQGKPTGEPTSAPNPPTGAAANPSQPTVGPASAALFAAPLSDTPAGSQTADASQEEEEFAGEAGVRGLTGVPLIEQMLGGEVVERIEPEE
ncbi:MAG: DNA polymerase III subunit gamma and tau [Micrococcales bacterium]|nr:DNA polymerase III subunit gamma and tau [Micrococcales bacterium]